MEENVETPKDIRQMSTTEFLQHVKEDFSDEIPSKIMRGEGEFKVRKGWFFYVTSGLQEASAKHLVPPELEEEVKAFVKHYTSDKFHTQALVTREDIDKGNKILDEFLEKHLPEKPITPQPIPFA